MVLYKFHEYLKELYLLLILFMTFFRDYFHDYFFRLTFAKIEMKFKLKFPMKYKHGIEIYSTILRFKISIMHNFFI